MTTMNDQPVAVDPLTDPALQDPAAPTTGEPVPPPPPPPIPPEILKRMGFDETMNDRPVTDETAVSTAGEPVDFANLPEPAPVEGLLPIPGSGPRYHDDVWAVRFPYLLERLGIQPGQIMEAPTFTISCDDGREYDLVLAAHKAIDVMLFQQSKISELVNASNEMHKQMVGLAQSLSQSNEKLAALERQVADMFKRLSIRPAAPATVRK